MRVTKAQSHRPSGRLGERKASRRRTNMNMMHSVQPCMVCFDVASTRLVCPSHDQHRLCGECACSYVRTLVGTAQLSQRDGGLPCLAADGTHAPSIESRPTVFSRDVIEPLLASESKLLQQYREGLLSNQTKVAAASTVVSAAAASKQRPMTLSHRAMTNPIHTLRTTSAGARTAPLESTGLGTSAST